MLILRDFYNGALRLGWCHIMTSVLGLVSSEHDLLIRGYLLQRAYIKLPNNSEVFLLPSGAGSSLDMQDPPLICRILP